MKLNPTHPNQKMCLPIICKARCSDALNIKSSKYLGSPFNCLCLLVYLSLVYNGYTLSINSHNTRARIGNEPGTIIFVLKSYENFREDYTQINSNSVSVIDGNKKCSHWLQLQKLLSNGNQYYD